MDKVQIDSFIALCRIYYKMPGNEMGGNLHLVLDDGNTDGDSIRFCLAEAIRAYDLIGELIASAFFKMDEETLENITLRYAEYAKE